MKKYAFHLVYLLIISILSYQLWAKTTVDARAFEQVERVLANDLSLIKSNTEKLKMDIARKAMAYPRPTFTQYAKSSEAIAKFVEHKLEWIKGRQQAIKRGEQVKISEIHDTLSTLIPLFLTNVDENDKNKRAKSFGLQKLIHTDSFSNGIKQNMHLYLAVLKNQIQTDVIEVFNYLFQNMNICDFGAHSRLVVMVEPKNQAAFEGETFEADIFLTPQIFYPQSEEDSNFTVKVNNQEIRSKFGIGHYKKTENEVGNKTMKVEIGVKNPLTGQFVSYDKTFEYRVLPKCCHDCH